jgi:hypothetical protein
VHSDKKVAREREREKEGGEAERSDSDRSLLFGGRDAWGGDVGFGNLEQVMSDMTKMPNGMVRVGMAD